MIASIDIDIDILTDRPRGEAGDVDKPDRLLFIDFLPSGYRASPSGPRMDSGAFCGSLVAAARGR
jgi:hypothetical protein